MLVSNTSQEGARGLVMQQIGKVLALAGSSRDSPVSPVCGNPRPLPGIAFRRSSALIETTVHARFNEDEGSVNSNQSGVLLGRGRDFAFVGRPFGKRLSGPRIRVFTRTAF